MRKQKAMEVGGLSGLYPGKYFKRMQAQRGLQGINRERLQVDLQTVQQLGSQIFSSASAASEQTSVLAAEQLRTRLEQEQKSNAPQTLTLDILA